jgi:ABC-type sugar transport system ATPase subunit
MSPQTIPGRRATSSPPALGAEVVRVNGVRKAFGETRALDGCTCTARSGEIHAIVGENGSGKSTLAKLLSGILRADEGDVQVLGGTPASPAHAARLGVAAVYQEVLLCEGATVLDNLFVGTDGFWRQAAPRNAKARIAQDVFTRLLGLPVDLGAIVDDLPLSMRQWITIGRALLRKPQVLILDEATAALDLEGAQKLLQAVTRLRDSGVCVLLVTHRIAEVTSFATRATVLRDGVAVGTVEGAELTETRLLALMTGEPEWREDARRRAAPAPGLVDRVVLRGTRVRLALASDAFDLKLREGEILGVIGLDGHGQAPFVRAAAGIEPPFDGTIEVAAEGDRHVAIDSERVAAANGICYIPGDRKLEGTFPNLSIFENFGMALFRRERTAGVIRTRRIRQAFREGARVLSIAMGRASAPIGTLSGGNQQKVLIARALAADPRIVLLNDPTRGVDISTKHDLYELLGQLADQGRAVVFLSSEIEELVGLCHRVAVFRNGTLFTTIPGEDVGIDRILAAMFGQASADEGDRS